MKEKIFSFITLLFIIFSLTACCSSSSDNEATATDAQVRHTCEQYPTIKALPKNGTIGSFSLVTLEHGKTFSLDSVNVEIETGKCFSSKEEALKNPLYLELGNHRADLTIAIGNRSATYFLNPGTEIIEFRKTFLYVIVI